MFLDLLYHICSQDVSFCAKRDSNPHQGFERLVLCLDFSAEYSSGCVYRSTIRTSSPSGI